MQLLAIDNLPEIKAGDNLTALLLQAMQAKGMQLEAGDIVVFAQKIVSKAEGRYQNLADVNVSQEAKALAAKAHKEPALVQLILDESNEVLRVRKGVIIVEHKQGYVHANAGIDRSNLQYNNDEQVLLLPKDCDRSAKCLSEQLSEKAGTPIAVIINDSAGRAWRNGTVGMTVGSYGIDAVQDLIGQKDRVGRTMEVSQVAVADELSAAASFVMGQGNEGIAAVIIRNSHYPAKTVGSKALIRDKTMDLFR